MTSPTATLEARLRAVEARLADLEGGFAQTLYRLHRRSVRADLILNRLAAQANVTTPTDDEVDAILDQE